MDVELVLWGYIQGDTHKEIVGCSNTVNASLSVNYHQCISIIFDILEQSSFQKYTTCSVFLALCHMLYLCILYLCICVFAYLRVWHMGISFFISLNNPLFKNIPHVRSFWHFVICCICVFVYLCICVCVFVYKKLGNISVDILGPRAFRKCMVCMV